MAVVFFFAGYCCIAELLPLILYLFGERRQGQILSSEPRYEWVFVCGLTLFWLLCYGIVALVRLRRSAQAVLFAMTLFLAFRFMTVPATNSCLYSQREIVAFRIIFLLPLIVSCAYLFRLRFAAKKQEIA